MHLWKTEPIIASLPDKSPQNRTRENLLSVRIVFPACVPNQTIHVAAYDPASRGVLIYAESSTTDGPSQADFPSPLRCSLFDELSKSSQTWMTARRLHFSATITVAWFPMWAPPAHKETNQLIKGLRDSPLAEFDEKKHGIRSVLEL